MAERLDDGLGAGRELDRAAVIRQRQPIAGQPADRLRGDHATARGDQRPRARPVRQPVAVARQHPRVAVEHLAAQLRLDRLRGRGRDRHRVRVDRPHLAGEVDHADQLAGVGVVDRSRRAGPLLDDLVEVLGREHLHRVLGGDRRSDRVGPGPALATTAFPPRSSSSRRRGAGPSRCPRPTAAPRWRRRRRSGAGTRRRSPPGTSGSAAPSRPAGGSPSAPTPRRHRRPSARSADRWGRRRPPPSVARSRRSEPAPARRRNCRGRRPRPTTNRSQARRSSLARVMGAVATSMASQGLVIACSTVPPAPVRSGRFSAAAKRSHATDAADPAGSGTPRRSARCDSRRGRRRSRSGTRSARRGRRAPSRVRSRPP